ncbi:NAGLU (predicted) [Pycnogonum litorale]
MGVHFIDLKTTERKHRWTQNMAIDIFYTFFVLQSMLALAHCAVVNQGDADQHLIKLNRIKTKTDERTQQKAVEGLISRLIPSKKDQIIVKIDTKFSVKGHDKFSVFSDGDHVTIIGNTGVSASWGLHHYLKYYCWCHVSWSGVQLNVPVKWPKANITVASNDRFRYYQNVCTASYSTVWWNWTRWEKEIDWMALNGMNLPLSFTGQEEIFRRLYTLYRIPELDFEEFFTGPAFLAWNRMGNIQSWAGPLPSSWYDQRLKLQHRILKRMREFGMTPVLPGFSGHVPLAMQKMFPSAKIHRLKSWGKFTFPYTNVSFLEPSDPLFQVMGSAFINIMTKEFGTDHIYNVDLFNEMDPPSGSV